MYTGARQQLHFEKARSTHYPNLRDIKSLTAQQMIILGWHGKQISFLSQWKYSCFVIIIEPDCFDDRVKVRSVSGHADRSMFNNVSLDCPLSTLSTLDVSLSAEHNH